MVRLVERQTNPDGTDQFVKLLSDPFKSQLANTALWSSLGFSLGITLLLVILFCAFRPYNATVYAPRVRYSDEKHRPPIIGRGPFAWFWPVFHAKEDELLDTIGLDATVFLRFTRMCRNVFLIMSIVGCGIMIPINVTQNYWKQVTPLLLMTPQNLNPVAFWAHVLCVWLFDGLLAFFLWINYRGVLRLKRRYYESADFQQSLHARTLLITDLPRKEQSDQGISAIVDSVRQVLPLPSTTIARNLKDLPELIEQHKQAVRKLESTIAKYLKHPNKIPSLRPMMKPFKEDHSIPRGQQVDAIEYLMERIRELETTIIDMRKRLDVHDPLPYGFATYTHIPQAHAVAYDSRSKRIRGASVMLAPRPNDLIWKNLGLTRNMRRTRAFINNFWIFLLTVVWVVPNILIAIFLSNLNNLGSVWPAFQTSLYAHPTWWGMVQGIASPAIFSGVYFVLPIIFRRLAIKAGDRTKTSRERHVIQRLYVFFVFNLFIIFTVYSTVWTFSAHIYADTQKSGGDVWEAIKKQEYAKDLSTSLINTSIFWVTWLLQRPLGATYDLSQLWNLLWRWCALHFSSPTPRQVIEYTAPEPFDYACYYNYFLFYATVALSFATLQPLVLPIVAFYFFLDGWMKKYLLMYVFVTKNESAGGFWRLIYNRLLYAAMMANVVMGLVVWAKGNSRHDQVWAIVPAPFLLLAFKFYCRWAFDDKIAYYDTGKFLTDSEALQRPKFIRHDSGRLRARYGHPAVIRKLMTPMFNARAQAVLPKMFSEGVSTSTDGGYQRSGESHHMAKMSKSSIGKIQAQQDAPFEFVTDNKLDFEYFKHRPEFAEEFGGEGTLYGRPEDIVRGDTPAPGRMTPIGSRPASPAPSDYADGRRQGPYGPPGTAGTWSSDHSTVYSAFSNADTAYHSRNVSGAGHSRDVSGAGIGAPNYQSSYQYQYHERDRSQSRGRKSSRTGLYAGEDDVGNTRHGFGQLQGINGERAESQSGLLRRAGEMAQSNPAYERRDDSVGLGRVQTDEGWGIGRGIVASRGYRGVPSQEYGG